MSMDLSSTQLANIRNRVIQSAARLDQHNAADYQTFMQALSAYAEVFNLKLLKADPSSILHAQGAAFTIAQLCELLFNARRENDALVKAAQQPATKGTIS